MGDGQDEMNHSLPAPLSPLCLPLETSLSGFTPPPPPRLPDASCYMDVDVLLR